MMEIYRTAKKTKVRFFRTLWLLYNIYIDILSYCYTLLVTGLKCCITIGLLSLLYDHCDNGFITKNKEGKKLPSIFPRYSKCSSFPHLLFVFVFFFFFLEERKGKATWSDNTSASLIKRWKKLMCHTYGTHIQALAVRAAPPPPRNVSCQEDIGMWVGNVYMYL